MVHNYAIMPTIIWIIKADDIYNMTYQDIVITTKGLKVGIQLLEPLWNNMYQGLRRSFKTVIRTKLNFIILIEIMLLK